MHKQELAEHSQGTRLANGAVIILIRRNVAKHANSNQIANFCSQRYIILERRLAPHDDYHISRRYTLLKNFDSENRAF